MFLPLVPAADPASAPPGKRRPWLKWILYPLLLIPLSIPLLLAGSVVYSLLTTDRSYRQEMEYAGELGIVRNGFREHFYGLKDYPAQSLDQLEAQDVLKGFAARALKKYRHEFVPFTPATPDTAVVLTIFGPRAQPDRFTKGDLSADPRTPDALPAATPSPFASPTSTP